MTRYASFTLKKLSCPQITQINADLQRDNGAMRRVASMQDCG
jgi:hypothetical protein